MHPTMVTAPGDEAAKARSQRAFEEIIDAALELGGTVTGEQQFKSKQGVVQSVPSVQAQYVLKLAR